MKRSTDRILTTHAGSLSRPAKLIAMSKAIAVGESKGDAAYAEVLAASVADVVKKQRELGVDIPDDGEFGKPVGGGSIMARGGIMPSRACRAFRRQQAPPRQRTRPSTRNRASQIWR